MKKRRLFAAALALLLALCLTPCRNTAALFWEGSSTGGNVSTSTGAHGYSCRFANSNKDCIAWRFSVVNSAGQTVSKVIDIFRCNKINGKQWGVTAYNRAYVFMAKYNKCGLIARQTEAMQTGRNTANCYLESELALASLLPNPGDMQHWIMTLVNLNSILQKCGIAQGAAGLRAGEKLLVEPMFDVTLADSTARLGHMAHALTVTELALIGRAIYGENSDAGTGVDGTFSYISNYTNRHYPNSLFTEDGKGLWGNAVPLSKKATFKTLIQAGYGVGIVYENVSQEADIAVSFYHTDIPYRKGTEVISAFRVTSSYSKAITSSTAISLRFTVEDYKGTEIYREVIRNIVIPAAGENLYWFNWTVPKTLSGGYVTLRCESFGGEGRFRHASPAIELHGVDEPLSMSTPDTRYVDIPMGGLSETPAVPAETAGAGWTAWREVNGSLTKLQYNASLSVTAALSSATGPSEYEKEDKTYVRSGYGLELVLFAAPRVTVSGGTAPVGEVFCTGAQTAWARFPEFSYRFGDGVAATLNRIGRSQDFIEDCHFIPLNFPDTDYVILFEASDCWTPIGCLSAECARLVGIDGTLYDDWYIGK